MSNLFTILILVGILFLIPEAPVFDPLKRMPKNPSMSTMELIGLVSLLTGLAEKGVRFAIWILHQTGGKGEK